MKLQHDKPSLRSWIRYNCKEKFLTSIIACISIVVAIGAVVVATLGCSDRYDFIVATKWANLITAMASMFIAMYILFADWYDYTNSSPKPNGSSNVLNTDPHISEPSWFSTRHISADNGPSYSTTLYVRREGRWIKSTLEKNTDGNLFARGVKRDEEVYCKLSNSNPTTFFMEKDEILSISTHSSI